MPRVMRMTGSWRKVLAHGLLFLFLAFSLTFAACGGGLTEEEVQSMIDATLEATGTREPSALRVTMLDVVDGAGNSRALLTTLTDGRPSLSFLDADGEVRAWLLLNQDGSPRLVLTDAPLVVLEDGAEEIRALLRLDPSGSPSMTLFDEAGTARVEMRVDEDGASLSMNDAEGNQIWTVPPEASPAPAGAAGE